MKKKILSLALIATVGLGALITPSCKKYEEGPSFSIKSKTARLTGKWKVDKVVNNDGTESAGDSNLEVEFTKGGTSIITSTDPIFSFSINGTWEFSSDKKQLTTVYTSFATTETTTAEIILLKDKEFATKETNGDKTYFISID